MASLNLVNPNAELARSREALEINVSAAIALQDILATNLGPKGTMKMLVSGGGDIKITKDGHMLLNEMHIQHPTASLIARVASTQDDITGDGTTSVVLLIGEILKQSLRFIQEGVHPRKITEGIEEAKKVAIEKLKELVIRKEDLDRDTLLSVARSSLATKVDPDVAELLTSIVVDSVLSIMPNENSEETEIDLHMVEIMEMVHKSDIDTKLVKGLVLDHGGRHPNMPKMLENCYVLTCNVSLEYDKSEVNSGFFYKSSEQRQQMVKAERFFTDDKVNKIIALKRQVCTPENNKSFVIVNQKGIDPISLEMLSNEGILALRRAKRRNMERLMKSCGGEAMNSVDELTPECLGYAGKIYQTKLNEDNFTFIEDTPKDKSVTVLIKGPAKHTISQIKDAVRDGLRAVKNSLSLSTRSIDNLLPGCGASEIFIHNKLVEFYQSTEMLKEQFGVKAFAESFLIIPKVLAKNAGHDSQEVLAKMQNEYKKNNLVVGVNLNTGEAINPSSIGVFDNFETKKLAIESAASISTNLLLVDEMIRAGLSSLKPKGGLGA